jgi:hypothetical protein
MRSLSAKLGVIFLVIGLTISCSVVWGADWKEFAEATTGVFHYDAASVTSPSKGLVRVWIHNVTKHETNLVEVNCMAASYRVLDVIEYDDAGRIKEREDYYDNSSWLSISPKSVLEPLHEIVCR